jgi:tRNA(His) 5'-end guanylyltransferase
LHIFELLATRGPREIPGIDSSHHPLPPFIDKKTWADVEALVTRTEKDCVYSVPGDEYMTLRLDGSGFSRLLARLRRKGVFAEGYCPTFAALMQSCCRTLMERHAALCGYTQSDEMTLIIPPSNVIRGVQQAHGRSGRVLKIATLAAATVTAVFNARVQVICAAHVPPVLLDDKDLPLFDCRIGRIL